MVAHPGCEFPSRRSGSKAEGSRQGCFASMHRDLGPAVRSTSSRSLRARGRSGPVARQRSALEDFLQARAGVLCRSGFAGKVLERWKRLRGGRGGKRLAGISPGMGALEIPDQGSNAAKTRGICFPALSVAVNTFGTLYEMPTMRPSVLGSR